MRKDFTPLRAIPLALIISIIPSPSHAATPLVSWGRAFRSSSPTGAVSVNALRSYGAGAVLGGSFQATTDFGCGPQQANGGTDGFVAAVSADGECLWVSQVGGPGAIVGITGLSVSQTGAIYVSGWFTNVITLDGSVLTSRGGTDGFLAMLDLGHHWVWATRFGGPGPDKGYGVAASADRVVATGYYTGTGDFGFTSLTSAGSTDAFFTAYSLDGTPTWATSVGGSGGDMGSGVAPWNGGFVATGAFSGTVDFRATTAQSRGGTDVFVAAYRADGTPVWVRTAGGTSDDLANAIEADPNGNPVFTGYSIGTIDFGDGPISGASAPAIFLAKYGAQRGELEWARSFHSPSMPLFGGNGRAVAVRNDGSIALTGSITDDVDFGAGALGADYTADIFLAEFAPDGRTRWSQRFPASFRDEGQAVAFTDAGGVEAAGVFAKAVNFGGGAALTGSGGVSSFLVSFQLFADPPTPTSTATSTRTMTASATPTTTPSPSPSASPSETPTSSVTPSATATLTHSPTMTATETTTSTPLVEIPTALPTISSWRICDVTRNGSISALDAARVLQFVAGVTDLDAEQQLLADASGLAGVSTWDAVLILQWVSGLAPVGTHCGETLPRQED